jgi:hypothetical protein
MRASIANNSRTDDERAQHLHSRAGTRHQPSGAKKRRRAEPWSGFYEKRNAQVRVAVGDPPPWSPAGVNTPQAKCPVYLLRSENIHIFREENSKLTVGREPFQSFQTFKALRFVQNVQPIVLSMPRPVPAVQIVQYTAGEMFLYLLRSRNIFWKILI